MEKDLTYILTVGDLHKHLTLRRRTGNVIQLQEVDQSDLFCQKTDIGPLLWVLESTFGPHKPDR